MEAKALPHGHIVLPYEIYRRLGLETGARLDVEFDEKTGCIYLRPVRKEKYSFRYAEKKKAKARYATQTKSPSK